MGDCIRSIRAQSYPDWEVVVVGQGPDGPAIEHAVRDASGGDHAKVRYVHLDRLGLCAARSEGVSVTTGDIVAFIDDDCTADPTWLAELVARFTPGVDGVCGAVHAPPPARPGPSICPEAHPLELTVTAADFAGPPPAGFAVLGANMAFRRSTLDATGRFDEQLGAGAAFGGGDEYDYLTRVLDGGGRLRTTPAAAVEHTHGRRHGWRAVWRYQRQRIRGDAGLAAKRVLMSHPDGEVPVVRATFAELGRMRHDLTLRRLPYNLARSSILLWSFVRGVRSFRLIGAGGLDPTQSVLAPRQSSGASST